MIQIWKLFKGLTHPLPPSDMGGCFSAGSVEGLFDILSGGLNGEGKLVLPHPLFDMHSASGETMQPSFVTCICHKRMQPNLQGHCQLHGSPDLRDNVECR